MFNKKIYLAAGWFNPIQALELTQLEEICDTREWIDLASPRRIFVCPPNAPKHVQDETFDGYAFANRVPIIYFCNGLPEGAKFNLMLARSGVKVCTSFEQLEDYLDRCFADGELICEQYDQEIE